MEQITSRQNPIIQKAFKLQNLKHAKQQQLILIEGSRNIELAHSHKLVETVFTSNPNRFENIDFILVTKEIIKKLSVLNRPYDCVAICKIPNWGDSYSDNFNKVLILDHLQDPGNIGTIIRTANAFNFDAVFVSDDSCSLLNTKLINATEESWFKIPNFQLNINEFLENSKFHIFGTSSSSEAIQLEKITNENIPNKYALLFGNEGTGIKSIHHKNINTMLNIKHVNIDSLNVASSAAIIMNHFYSLGIV